MADIDGWIIDGDSILGTSGNDNMDLSDDTISAELADSTIFGVGGDDVISSGEFSAIGGGGDDSITGTLDGDILSVAEGGGGNDTVTANIASGGQGDDVLWGDHIVSGNDGDDTLTIEVSDPDYDGDEANSAFGGDGNDSIMADGDNGATLDGGAGNDTIVAGDGSDSIYGGGGDDAIYVSGGNDWIHAGEGDDTIYFEGLVDGEIAYVKGFNLEDDQVLVDGVALEDLDLVQSDAGMTAILESGAKIHFDTGDADVSGIADAPAEPTNNNNDDDDDDDIWIWLLLGVVAAAAMAFGLPGVMSG